MELLQQQQLPEPLELRAGILAAPCDREELRVVQPLLAAPVAALDERLRRVVAAVVLEVQLADDDGPSTGLRLERDEELVGVAVRVRGRPCRSRARVSVSSISRVGPPPPSP